MNFNLRKLPATRLDDEVYSVLRGSALQNSVDLDVKLSNAVPQSKFGLSWICMANVATKQNRIIRNRLTAAFLCVASNMYGVLQGVSYFYILWP